MPLVFNEQQNNSQFVLPDLLDVLLLLLVSLLPLFPCMFSSFVSEIPVSQTHRQPRKTPNAAPRKRTNHETTMETTKPQLPASLFPLSLGLVLTFLLLQLYKPRALKPSITKRTSAVP